MTKSNQKHFPIKTKAVPKKKLSDLAFFRQGYMSFTDDQTKSAVKVANELREKAWKRDYN
ncbi:MAG TPA: hypothetical protein VF209_05180 [Patescibacteria group bacterium]